MSDVFFQSCDGNGLPYTAPITNIREYKLVVKNYYYFYHFLSNESPPLALGYNFTRDNRLILYGMRGKLCKEIIFIDPFFIPNLITRYKTLSEPITKKIIHEVEGELRSQCKKIIHEVEGELRSQC